MYYYYMIFLYNPLTNKVKRISKNKRLAQTEPNDLPKCQCGRNLSQSNILLDQKECRYCYKAKHV